MAKVQQVEDFFALIGEGQDDEAMDVFRRMAFPDGVDGSPSPTARDCMEAGEWDAKLSVQLYLVTEDCCQGRIGAGEPLKVCAKHKDACQVAAHQGGKPRSEDVANGWRIGVGVSVSSGVYASPYLVDDEVKGPIKIRCKLRFCGIDNPFRMPVAHWRMVIAYYLEGITSMDSPSASIPLHKTHPSIDPSFDEFMSQPSDGRGESLEDDTISKEAFIKVVEQLVKPLVERIEDLEFKVREYQRSTRNLSDKVETVRQGAMADSISVTEQVRSVELDMHGIDTRVGDLEAESKRMGSVLAGLDRGSARLAARVESGGIIHFHGRVFGSPSELAKFSKLNGIRIGCTADAFLLMHISRCQAIGEDESLKTRKGRVDTKVGSGIESLFVASFDTNFPASLSPSKNGTGGETSSAFQVLKKVMKDALAWESDDTNDGVRVSIMNSADQCSERIRSFAENAGLPAPGSEFCSYLMSDSHRFVTRLVEFLSRFHYKHTKQGNLKPSLLWDLCMELLAHILEEIVKVRNIHVDSAAIEPAYYLWGMLRAWEIQQRYLKNNFEDDPALNGIFTRRALLRKDESVVQLEKDLRALQTKVANMAKKG